MVPVENGSSCFVCDQWFGEAIPLERHLKQFLHVLRFDFFMGFEPLNRDQPYIALVPRHDSSNRIDRIMLCLT